MALKVPSRDEIGVLTESFNTMARSLREKEMIKRAFTRYVAREVVEEILKNPEKLVLSGERREVTVLFCDVRGFTPLSERLSPEEVVSLLNDFYTLMIETTFKHDGTLDKFMGDAVMAIFGAPIAHPDHSARAVQTALAMREGIGGLNARRAQQGKEGVAIGIGVSAGEAVAGTVGTEDRMEYTVIGDSVNLAARLESNAKPGPDPDQPAHMGAGEGRGRGAASRANQGEGEGGAGRGIRGAGAGGRARVMAIRRPPSGALAMLAATALVASACATASAPPTGTEASAPSARTAAAPPPRQAPPVATPAPAPPPPPPLPESFSSEDFIVAFAKAGDTAQTLAARYLGDAAQAWMIEDYTGLKSFEPGQEVVIPRHPWNPSGVDANGYQIIPILCYHNLGPESKGRLLLAASKFEEQMRYLKDNGYRVISLAEFIEFTRLNRQLPKKSVVLTFDDGYRSFKQYAYPILKELGFTATLFVYTDFVGGGRNAFTWQDLKELAAEGFDIEAHSKSHGDLRRAAGETEAQHFRRLQAELGQPQELFRRNLGSPRKVIAFPYGSWDEAVLSKLAEYGYSAGFSVRRQGNASFTRPQAGNRSQVYSEMSFDDFIKNLNVYQQESLK